VPSCDAYSDLWTPFFQCLFRYWPECPYPVFLGANERGFEHSRVTSLKIGPDRDYSSNLLGMTEHVPHRWILTWLDDRFLSAPVDTEGFAAVVGLAERVGAGYVKVIDSHPFALRPIVPGAPIGEIPPGSRYRVCITVALWRREVLRAILCPGESPWDIERRGSGRSNGFKEPFLALTLGARARPPVRDCHVLVKGRLARDAIPFLRRDRLLHYLSGRRPESFCSLTYGRAYVGGLDAVAFLADRLPWPFDRFARLHYRGTR